MGEAPGPGDGTMTGKEYKQLIGEIQKASGTAKATEEAARVASFTDKKGNKWIEGPSRGTIQQGPDYFYGAENGSFGSSQARQYVDPRGYIFSPDTGQTVYDPEIAEALRGSKIQGPGKGAIGGPGKEQAAVEYIIQKRPGGRMFNVEQLAPDGLPVWKDTLASRHPRNISSLSEGSTTASGIKFVTGPFSKAAKDSAKEAARLGFEGELAALSGSPSYRPPVTAVPMSGMQIYGRAAGPALFAADAMIGGHQRAADALSQRYGQQGPQGFAENAMGFGLAMNGMAEQALDSTTLGLWDYYTKGASASPNTAFIIEKIGLPHLMMPQTIQSVQRVSDSAAQAMQEMNSQTK